MIPSLSRRLTSTLAAAAVALTGLNAPAHAADGEDIAKFLAGAATIFIIGSAIDSARRDRNASTVPSTPHHPYPDPYDYRRGDDRDPYWRPGGGTHPVYPVHPGRPHRPEPQPVTRRLPGQCLSTIPTAQGTYNFMGRRCLAQNAPRTALPQSCLREIQGYHREREVYGASCLRRAGFVF